MKWVKQEKKTRGKDRKWEEQQLNVPCDGHCYRCNFCRVNFSLIYMSKIIKTMIVITSSCIFCWSDRLNKLWIKWNRAKQWGEQTYVCFSNTRPRRLRRLGWKDSRESGRKSWGPFGASRRKPWSPRFWSSNDRFACYERQHPAWTMKYVNITEFRIIRCAVYMRDIQRH